MIQYDPERLLSRLPFDDRERRAVSPPSLAAVPGSELQDTARHRTQRPPGTRRWGRAPCRAIAAPQAASAAGPEMVLQGSAPAGSLLEDQGPEPAARGAPRRPSPFANQPKKRRPAKLAMLLLEVSLTPQILVPPAGAWAGVWRTEAGGSRERTCFSSVSVSTRGSESV